MIIANKNKKKKKSQKTENNKIKKQKRRQVAQHHLPRLSEVKISLAAISFFIFSSFLWKHSLNLPCITLWTSVKGPNCFLGRKNKKINNILVAFFKIRFCRFKHFLSTFRFDYFMLNSCEMHFSSRKREMKV